MLFLSSNMTAKKTDKLKTRFSQEYSGFVYTTSGTKVYGELWEA